MCKFCDLLYSEEQADDRLHNEVAADLIYYDKDGELNIQVDTGDPYESGILSNITFCPYCGRNLKELYGPFIKGVLERYKMGKSFDQFEEIVKDMRSRIESGEINGDGVQTLYLGLIAGYLATIVDELQELNDGGRK